MVKIISADLLTLLWSEKERLLTTFVHIMPTFILNLGANITYRRKLIELLQTIRNSAGIKKLGFLEKKYYHWSNLWLWARSWRWSIQSFCLPTWSPDRPWWRGSESCRRWLGRRGGRCRGWRCRRWPAECTRGAAEARWGRVTLLDETHLMMVMVVVMKWFVLSIISDQT